MNKVEIKRVLFVCVENSCRSQLAEAISNGVYCVSTPSSSSVYDIIFDNQYGFITKSFCHKELSQIILNSLDRNGFDNSKFINKFYIDSCGTKFLDLI